MKRLLIVAIAALAAGACGAPPDTLPEPAVCASPTAVPSATPATRRAEGFYAQAVNQGSERLKQNGTNFLARWPSRKFSRDARFREDLLAAADQGACIATQLQALKPPSERWADYDVELDLFLDEYGKAMAEGREAARQRNVSKYRDWLKAVDELPSRIDTLRAKMPQFQPRP